MAHFAEIDSDNKVLRVVVVDNQDVDNNGGDQSTGAENFVATLIPFSSNGVRWVQTSYNHNFRGRYAGADNTYNAEYDRFIPGQPFSSWTLNTSNFTWEAPTPMPVTYNNYEEPFNDIYNWNEETQSWDLVS